MVRLIDELAANKKVNNTKYDGNRTVKHNTAELARGKKVENLF